MASPRNGFFRERSSIAIVQSRWTTTFSSDCIWIATTSIKSWISFSYCEKSIKILAAEGRPASCIASDWCSSTLPNVVLQHIITPDELVTRSSSSVSKSSSHSRTFGLQYSPSVTNVTVATNYLFPAIEYNGREASEENCNLFTFLNILLLNSVKINVFVVITYISFCFRHALLVLYLILLT